MNEQLRRTAAQPPPATAATPATTTNKTLSITSEQKSIRPKGEEGSKEKSTPTAAAAANFDKEEKEADYKNNKKHTRHRSWKEYIGELRSFVANNGHARVRYKDSPHLANWITDIRYEYKRLQSSLSSMPREDDRQKELSTAYDDNNPRHSRSLNTSRIQLLETELGFVWQVLKSFEQRLDELRQYKEEHGDLLVKRKNGPLGDYVHRLRKLKRKNELKPERIRQLEDREYSLYYSRRREEKSERLKLTAPAFYAAVFFFNV